MTFANMGTLYHRSLFLSILYSALLLVPAAFMIGCSENADSKKQVFRYNEATGIASLDPAFAKNQSVMWAVHQLYNTLVEVDSNLNIVPSLAKAWTVSPDRKTYTFYLRRGVYFHDNPAFPGGKGRELVATDVVYSLNRIIEPSVASSGAWIFNGRVDTAKPFVALNDTTLQLKLLHPFHPILGILTMPYCSIVPKEVVERFDGDFRRNPCGTGPFFLKYWQEGDALVLHKNYRYWQHDSTGKRLPYLDAVQVSFFNNKSTEFLQFRQGKLSFVNDIGPAFKDELLTRSGDLRNEWKGKLVLKKHPYLNVEYFGILTGSNSPLHSKLVRQAINYAIDRDKLVLYLRNSIGIAAKAGFVPAGLPSLNTENVKGYGYNPKKALDLLNKAGYFTSMHKPVVTLTSIPMYAEIASFVAKELENIGMNVKVDIVQKSLLLEQTAKGTTSFFRGSWIADYPDAENYMAVFYSKNPAPPNYTRYKNEAFDKLYEQALQETIDSARYKLYHQMDQLVIEDAPIVPIWYDMVLHVLQPNLKSFQPNALNMLELRWARFDEE